MKIGVCGCSWMSAVQNESGKHFTEILAKKLNWEYRTLARGACSNSAIRLQVSAMIKEEVDLILVGVTSPNRIDFPINNKAFDKNLGIYNYDYKSHPDLSSMNFSFKHNNFISDTLNNLTEGNVSNLYKEISNGQYTAIESYIRHLFDVNYREQQDAWIIQSAVAELNDSGISYFLITQEWLNQYYPFTQDNKEFIKDKKLLPWSYYDKHSSNRWHTSDESQEKLANFWWKFLNNA